MKHLSKRYVTLLAIGTILSLVGACGKKGSPPPQHADNGSIADPSSPQDKESPSTPAPVPPANTANTPRSGDCLKLAKLGGCLSFNWSDSPKMNQFNSAQVKLTTPTAPVHLKAFLWMPSMNHGSSPIKIEAMAPGEWRLNKIWFVMGGDWTLHLQLLDDSGKLIDEVAMDLVL